jgi:signal transduction histidine kinase
MRAGASDYLVKTFDAAFKDVLGMALARIARVRAAEAERAQLTRDRDLLREAIENSNDGLAVVNRDGGVRHCNSAFLSALGLFGATDKNVLSIPPQRLVRGAETLSAITDKLQGLGQGAVWATELLSIEKDGAAVDLSLSMLRDDKDAEPSLVFWLRDARERRRREKFQREILSTTTHDLKGPLGAISISCEVLLDRETADARTRTVLERISSSASSAIHLIEELLSARRIEEGTFLLKPRNHELEPTVRKVLTAFAMQAETRGLTLECSIEAGVTGCVDELGLERVISNLVGNGIKFTPRGGTITVAAQPVSGGATVSVRDTGCGMEPSDAQRLFQRYQRLPGHAAIPGSGLGLFIVKSIVSAHGGAIDVTSAIGEGTVFEVFFPDAPPLNARGEVLCLDFA